MSTTDIQATPDRLASIGARTVPEFDGVHDVWPRGERLRAPLGAA